MTDDNGPEAARDPQDLERFIVQRQRAGDVEGMVALFESNAAIVPEDGRPIQGHDAIRAFFVALNASGRKFDISPQQPAVICGDLALTSTRSLNGHVTAEVARRQSDGRWLRVIDRFVIA